VGRIGELGANSESSNLTVETKTKGLLTSGTKAEETLSAQGAYVQRIYPAGGCQKTSNFFEAGLKKKVGKPIS
jgi:hypothetical protein